MARVVPQVPDFASIVSARPVTTGLPAGAVIATTIGNSLSALATNAMQKKQEKDTINQFADVMAETDPQSANLYRAYANNIPLFDAGVLTNGGGGSGGGGMQGNIMESMLRTINQERELKNALALQSQRTDDTIKIDQIRHVQNLGEIEARGQERLTLEEVAQAGRETIQKMRADASAEKDLTARAKMLIEIQRLEHDQRTLEERIRHNKEEEQRRVEQMKVDAAKAILNDEAKQKGLASKVNNDEIQRYIATNPKLVGQRDAIERQLADPNTLQEDRAALRSQLDIIHRTAWEEILKSRPQVDPMGGVIDRSLFPANTPVVPQTTVKSLLQGVR